MCFREHTIRATGGHSIGQSLSIKRSPVVTPVSTRLRPVIQHYVGDISLVAEGQHFSSSSRGTYLSTHVIGFYVMYEILLPVDDSTDRAAAQARYVSRLSGETDEITVTVAHAYRDDSSGTGDDSFDEESPGVIEATDILSTADVTVEQRELHFPVAESIVDLASELDVDDIVLCGRKRSPAGKVLFGSITQSVALKSSVPVTIVPVE